MAVEEKFLTAILFYILGYFSTNKFEHSSFPGITSVDLVN